MVNFSVNNIHIREVSKTTLSMDRESNHPSIMSSQVVLEMGLRNSDNFVGGIFQVNRTNTAIMENLISKGDL